MNETPEHKDKNTSSEILRKKAETLLGHKVTPTASKPYEADLMQLIYELEVHQVELALQNDELISARTAARDAAEKYTNLYEFAPVGYFTISGSGRILEVNLTGTRMFGKDRSQLQNSLFDKQLSADTRSVFNLFRKKVLNSRKNESCDVTLLPDGNVPVYLHLSGVSTGNGEQCLVTAVDITERKMAEEALREKDIQFEKLSSAVPDLIYQFTRKPDGTYCVPIASPGIQNVFGCSPEDVRDDFGPIARVIFPEDSARVISNIEYSAEHLTYFTCEFRVQIPGKEIQWIFSRSVPERLKDGSITWYGFNTDITMIKKTQEILRESEERFRSVAESAYDAIITIDIKGRISGWNKAAEKMFGYSSGEATGKELSFIIPPHYIESHKIGLKRMEQGGNHHVIGNVVELAGLRKDGTEFPIELSLSEWETGSGKFFTGIIRDITDRKRTDQELIQAKEKAEESDHLKSAFLANMSHEIRTPMNGILGFAGLLKEPGLSGEEQQQYIRIIEKSGARMLNIINDIIDISKIEAGQMAVDTNESNINDHIEDIYTFFKPEVEAKGILFSYKCSLPGKEANIITDHHKFDAILINLVKNAIKYTNQGTIEFGYNLVGTHHGVSPHGISLQFYVKDTGIGIPGDRREAIFERFIQADISDKHALQGAGLGLAISKAYVEMLGGKIWVESVEENGSIFYFTIPYNTGKLMPDNIHNVALQEDLTLQNKKLKILIAEDDETSDFLITTMLKNNSRELIHVNSGDQAVDTCQRHPDLDLVLMDIKMPGIDGYEATRRIRHFNKDIIIIAQTAYGLSGDREKALESGCNDYIPKPISKEELLLLLQKHFINR